ncbi:MAG: cation:proton antiporter [Mycobacteriales bacterium]
MTSPPIATILLELAGILLVARLMGQLFRRIGQPPVVGEILAGILLGKTVLDHIGPGYTDVLFPPAAVPYLKVIAALGLVLYMFVVGMEIDTSLIRGKERTAASISVGSILVPFSLGIVLSLWLFTQHRNDKGLLPFALFVGAAMSITAFPVLARILTDRRMHRTELGGITLASAAVDDIIAWSLLAVVVIVAGTGEAHQWHIALAVPYLAVMFFGVRPLLRRLVAAYHRAERLTPDLFAIVLVGVLASAWVTEWLGVHYIFGAFLFGALFPREGATALLQDILERLEHVSVLLLLPVFFVVTGLGVDIGKLSPALLGQLGLILLVAVGGKFLGAYLGARVQRIQPRRAGAIAVLMNTRGLTELVVLAVGREAGILDESLYTLLVVMAIVTTIMTGPLLKQVYPDRWVNRDVADAERQALGIPDAYRVLVAVDDPGAAEHLVDVAAGLIAGERPAEVVLTTIRPYATKRLEVGSGLRSELLEMATTATALDALSARAAVHGVPCTVLTRLGDDVAAELLSQATAVDADVVLLGGRGALSAVVLADAPAQVIVTSAPPDLSGAVEVLMAPGTDGDAAIETGVRLARFQGGPLTLVHSGTSARRRASAVADHLRRAGMTVAVEPAGTAEPPASRLLVVAASARPSGQPTLVVRAEVDRRPTDWVQLVGRIRPPEPADR